MSHWIALNAPVLFSFQAR